ncbi:hypothetical protein C0989_002946, partial [Termitomyces sp. Mn162]
MGDANNEKEEPAKANDKNIAESEGIQKNDEEYVELKTYGIDYYTQESDSEGLFAPTEIPTAKHRLKEPGNKVHMQKVWIMAAKDAMDQLVLPAQDK